MNASGEHSLHCHGHKPVELIRHIDMADRIRSRGEFLPVPLLSCISFGPPMWLERGEAKLDFLARARRAVLALKE
jgi:hypothetical protein